MTLFIFPSLSSFELKFLFFGFSLIFLLFFLRRSIVFQRFKMILLVLQLIYLLLNLTSIAGNFKGEGIKYSSFDWQLARIFEISCGPNVNFNLSDLYFHYNRNYLSRYNTYGLNISERNNKKNQVPTSEQILFVMYVVQLHVVHVVPVTPWVQEVRR